MSKPSNVGDWIVRKPRPARAHARLFCFPYSGGGPSAFRGWAEALPNLEVCAIQAPGRETRLREAPLTRIEPLADAITLAIRPLLDQPFAFFGFSLGSFVAFEVARRLRRQGAPMPARLFLGACPAPQLHRVDEPIHALPEADLVARLQRYQGTPAEVLEHRELMELLLPILRADFAVYESYAHTEEPPLDAPITALGGLADAEVPKEKIEGWREHTKGAFVQRMFPGGHFFLHSERARVLAMILQDLSPLLTR